MKGGYKKQLYLLVIILSVIALLFSVIILIEKYTNSDALNNFCTALDSQSQCQAVQQSKYSSILGIANPWFGIVGFIALALLAGLNYRKEHKVRTRLITAGSIFSGAMALYFIYVQSVLLQQYCIFCLVVDVSSIILMMTGFYMLYLEYH